MEEKRNKKSTVSDVLRIYWAHARRYPVAIFCVFLGAVIIQAGLLTAPLFLRQFFNVLVAGDKSAATVHQLYTLLALVGSMYLIEQVGLRLRDYSNGNMQAKVMPKLMETAFTYLLGHSYTFFISNFAGSLTSKVSRFGKAFEGIFDSIVLSFFPTFIFVMGSIVVLFFRNHILGVALLLWSIAFIWFQVYISKIRLPIREQRAASDTKVTATIADAIANQFTISLFSGAESERNTLRGVLGVWQKITVRLWNVDNLIWGGIGLFMITIEVGLLSGAVFFWQKGLLTIGDFVLIQAYLLVTFDRLVSLNREFRGFYSNFADAAEMVEILNTPHEIHDKVDARAIQVKDGTIEFKDITFSFNESKNVLNSFSLSVPGKKKIALVGPSGAGKSTITKLLLRMFDIGTGSIEIDGQNIAHVTQNSLHEAISYVPQEPVLFHRTLLENIRYGKQDASLEEVIEAAKKAHCHEFIMSLTDGYHTYVGERGVKLSGGERQRVAIARALLKEAPILLLDEATSSLDSESEALIQDALEILMRDKTVIVIAHRLSTILKMDTIVVLDGGVIAAKGTHADLLAQDGLYKKLWSIQAGGFIPDEDEATEVLEKGLELTEEELAKDTLSE